ncbi:transcriptional regulator [Actinoplanes lobatus]|uniref:AraC-like DNA-binding protein n=1 Tax=Actinoplanes lobatus TaxID=113568 RepID=A0A7W7MDS2_9ACTN|nr:helix-turn-helix domain-containing protein [Actinoplanes lobatus]MBB4746478.1 AraC-like DNA-binding protein [Actinoplanes lobatus]GGN52661.1 transcriptional regulator [Actinoplanes lobatus]GIE45050.1 transcriptional regulator [Actinoplanes lobatus]
MIHSIPAAPGPAPCRTAAGRPDPRLRRHVLAYSAFSTTTPVAHRLLPINVPVLVVDLTGECRVATGPRSAPGLGGPDRWRRGVTVGLTPAGMSALLGGIPPRELAGRAVPLADVLGRADAALAEHLAGAPTWAARFRRLDTWLTARLDPNLPEDPLVTAAWWRLQRGTGRARVGAVAAGLGVGRRHLEVAFQRALGLSPGTVARIARFQRAVGLVAAGAPLSRAAADAGYADQPHLTRDMRALAGLTPGSLRAFVQDRAAVSA